VRRFYILWAGQLVSMVGSELTAFVLAIWIYQQHGSLSQYAIFSVVSLLPTLFISPFSGAIIDRINRRWAIIICDIGAAVGPVAILGLLWAGHLEVWAIYVALLVASVFSSAQASAYPAAVAQLVPRDKLAQANGLSQLRGSIPEILCPLLGGVLLARMGLEGVVTMDSLSFVVGIVATLAIVIPDLVRKEEPERLTPKALLADIADAVRHLRTHRDLGAFLVLLVLISFFHAIGRIVFIPYMLSFASESMLGIYLAIGGVAMVAASIAMSSLPRPRSLVQAMAITITIMGIGIALLSCRTSHIVFMIGLALLYAGIAIYASYATTFWQTKIKGEMLGRVFSLRISLGTLASILAYVLTGPLVERIQVSFEQSTFVESFPLTRWLIGPERGVAMGYVLLASGLLVAACGVVMNASVRFRAMSATPDEVD